MRLLFLSRWYPCPPDNGSKLRICNLLKGLAQQHLVTLVSFAEGGEPLATAGESFPAQRVEVVQWRPFRPRSRWARLGFLSPTPRFFLDTYSPEMAERIRRTLAEERYDAVIASQQDMARYADRFGGLPALFEEVEVGGMYEQYARAPTPLRRLRYRLTWEKHRRFLQRMLKRYRACTVVSETEKALLEKILPASLAVRVIPNFLELADYRGVEASPRPGRLIFTGSFAYAPNYQAMEWFLEQVFPAVLERIPEAEVWITGDHQGKSLPAAGGTRLTGHVPDVRPLVASAWASVVPIRSGGGTRLKILEAMALRTPVVATRKGAEGLEVVDGQHLLLADTPEEFAGAILRLHEEEGLRARIAANAYEFLRERHDSRVVVPRFLELVGELGRG